MRTAVALFVLVLLAGCVAGPSPSPNSSSASIPAADAGTFAVRSSAFQPGQAIPSKYTCDAGNNPPSPPLTFSGVPSAARTFALIVEDPDAPSGTVTHWTWWNVPASHADLPEGANIQDLGGTVGQAYRGMCPPAPPAHRYFFYGFAVDGNITPASGSPTDVRAALTGHTKASDQMFGTYVRPALPR